MIFKKLRLKAPGVVTYSFQREISSNLFPIGWHPRGFVRMTLVDWEIYLWSRPCVHTFYTGGCIKTTRKFQSEFNFSNGTFQVDYEPWAIDTKQPKIIRISLFLFMFETDTESEHEKIIFHRKYHRFMYLWRVCLHRIVVSRFFI